MGDLSFNPYVFFVGINLRLLNPFPQFSGRSWRPFENVLRGQRQASQTAKRTNRMVVPVICVNRLRKASRNWKH